jgi:hypothetical protein
MDSDKDSICKGTIIPFPDNSLITTTAGLNGILLKQCPCTSPNLHYEIRLDGCTGTSFYHHDQLILRDNRE